MHQEKRAGSKMKSGPGIRAMVVMMALLASGALAAAETGGLHGAVGMFTTTG